MTSDTPHDEIQAWASDCLDAIETDFHDADFDAANMRCKTAVKHCATMLASDMGSDGALRTIALIAGILFRGLADCVHAAHVTARVGWIQSPKVVEEVWQVLWDAKERISYAMAGCTHAFPQWCLERIDAVINHIKESFGDGPYVSPEIVCKQLRCSICGQDMRSCTHLPGSIYQGRLCVGIPGEFETIRFVSMVDDPKDPRCRVWPWNVEADDNGTIKVVDTTMLCSFRLDDFDL
ncbi:MAG: hypothetical protein BIFFINMI_02501 [Phycisphaerae bacterium]|nr:hypothetical protein [Phycisphaerae bacterium]